MPGPGDVVVLQGNLTRASSAAALSTAFRNSATTLFNPSPLWWDAKPLLPHCCAVIVNRGEAEALTGLTHPEAAAAALDEAGANMVVVTLGAEGCILRAVGTTELLNADAVTAIDTSGCGDTLRGVFASMLALGHDPRTAVVAGQRAAAMTARRPGAFLALPDRQMLDAVLPTREDPGA